MPEAASTIRLPEAFISTGGWAKLLPGTSSSPEQERNSQGSRLSVPCTGGTLQQGNSKMVPGRGAEQGTLEVREGFSSPVGDWILLS